MITSEVKITASKCAISHVLQLIKDDERVRFLLGAGTESFGRLTEAASKLYDEPVDEVREYFIPGSSGLYRERRGKG